MTEKRLTAQLSNHQYRTKSLISLLHSMFEGKIHLVRSVETDYCCRRITWKIPILGFDTETDLPFKRGPSTNVLCCNYPHPTKLFLFRSTISPEPGKNYSRQPSWKIGAAIHDDIKVLQRIAPFKPNGFIDLQDMAKPIASENLSLKNWPGLLWVSVSSKSRGLPTGKQNPFSTEQQQIYSV